jgi:hypothetical protein
MTHDDTPMWEDPQESSALRQLLRAGRVENSDYDVDSGLARHLAQLQAGAQVPAWAVQTTLQKSTSWSLLAWLLPPMISAGVVGAWLAVRPAEPVTALVPPPPPAAQLAAAPRVAVAEPAAPVLQQVAQTAQTAQTEQPDSPEVNGAPQQEREQSHRVAAARASRPAARVVNTRRGRASRLDDANANIDANANANNAYAIAAVGGAVGQGGPSRELSGGVSGLGINSASGSASEAAAAKNAKAAPLQEPAPATEEAKAERKPKPNVKDEAGASAKSDEVTGARLEREMRMLAVAQRVLTEDPERSLKLCRQGENEFRGSMFSAERKQVALLALVQLGRVDEARREGIPFLRAFPNAPWSARLREALSSGRLPNH